MWLLAYCCSTVVFAPLTRLLYTTFLSEVSSINLFSPMSASDCVYRRTTMVYIYILDNIVIIVVVVVIARHLVKIIILVVLIREYNTFMILCTIAMTTADV